VINWGTKWNALPREVENEPENIMNFLTAWSPPVPVVVKLSRLFPMITLILEAYDPQENIHVEDCEGMIRVTLRNGQIISEELVKDFSL
jgi:hypothetical protein